MPALLIAASLLAACSSLQPSPPAGATAPPPLPAAWQGSAPAADAAAADGLAGAAWQGFADPLLAALVDEALAANLDLQAAQARLAQARALVDVAAAGQQPTLGSSASAGRSRSGNQTGNSLRVGLDASWEADLFGANAAATRAARAGAESSAATLQATRLSVAAETALAYVAWQGVREQLRVAEASLASQRQTLELVQARVGSGLADHLELQQANSTLEQAQARVPALRLTLAQDEHALALLLGQPPAALSARLAAAPLALPRAPALPALPLPAELLRRRPDLRAAELQIDAELATLAQTDAQRKPSFTLSGNLALQAATLAGLGQAAALVAGLAAGVDWTIFDGGAGAARVAAQRSALDQARIAWRSAVLVALQDVEDGLAALARGQERVSTLQRASAAADEAASFARIRWQAGLTDFTTLLDAERSALSAGDSLASARTELASAHIRLLKSLGGGIGIHSSASAS